MRDLNKMPNYTFKNTETNEEIDMKMSISERDIFVSKNPHMQQILKTMNLVDPVGIGVSRPPSDFQKHVLGRMAQNVPGATAIASKRWGIPREF